MICLRTIDDNMSERVKILSILLEDPRPADHVAAMASPLPDHLYRLFTKDHSRFGFACHLFLDENRKLDTARRVDPAPAQVWENAALPLKFHVVQPSPSSADGAFHRKFVSEQLRALGIIERVNLQAGCVSSPAVVSKPAPPPVPAKPRQQQQQYMGNGNTSEEEEEGAQHPELVMDCQVEEEDNDDDDAYANLVILTAHQYGLDLVRYFRVAIHKS